MLEIGPAAVHSLRGHLPFGPHAIAEADGSLWALASDGVHRSTRRDVPTFVAPAAGAPAPGLVYAIAVDLDRDGDEDLIGLRARTTESSYVGSAALVVALNDGAGHFVEASLGLPRDVVLWRDRFDVGDVDGDGDLDVALATSGGRVELWLQEGRRFSRAWSRPIEGATLALVDVDGDGDLDLSVIPGAPGVLVNDGAGNFDEARAVPLPVNRTERVAWADVDGDGDADAVLLHWRDPAHLLVNEGRSFTLVELPVVAEGAAFGDLDRDGVPELLAQKIHVRGVALPFTRCAITKGGACAPDLHPTVPAGLVADLNLDGRADVIGTDLRGDEAMTSDGEVFVAAADGSGYQRVTEITGPMPRPAVIDADGDGDPDVYSPAAGLRINTADPATFVRIRPRASRSDRLARGASIALRRAGQGAIVASARADFGVATLGLPDASARYDVEVRFPAGERRVLAGVTAGTDAVVRDADDLAYDARLALLWATGTVRRARPIRDLALPLLLVAGALVAARGATRCPYLRVAVPLFGAAYLALSGWFLRLQGSTAWLLTPAAAGIAALGQGGALWYARRRAMRLAGPYVLDEKLGAGAAATVWRARAGRSWVALKLFSAESMDSPEARERFFREARVGSEIKHPNVVRIRDAGELEDGRCFLAMELVEGRSLADRIREEGRLPPAAAVSIAVDVARALAALHDADIVHRDVKPENILVRPDGSAVLTDLGLARSALFKTLTRHDVAVGTLSYMSPEQCVGRPLDGRSDLWSLGVTLYEMLTGKRPFVAKHELELVYVIHNVDPPPPSSSAVDVPAALDAVVMRCLAREPEDRFASARDLEDALGGAVPAAVVSRSGERVTGRTSFLPFRREETGN